MKFRPTPFILAGPEPEAAEEFDLANLPEHFSVLRWIPTTLDHEPEHKEPRPPLEQDE